VNEIGFGRKDVQPRPSIAKWLGVSFLIACCYWAVAEWLFPGVVTGAFMPMFNPSPGGSALLACIPILIALGLTVPFRISWDSPVDWLINLVAAGFATNFAQFLMMFAADMIRR
jgi:hypothetical protein